MPAKIPAVNDNSKSGVTFPGSLAPCAGDIIALVIITVSSAGRTLFIIRLGECHIIKEFT